MDFDSFAMSNIEDMEYDSSFSTGSWSEVDDCGDCDCRHYDCKTDDDSDNDSNFYS